MSLLDRFPSEIFTALKASLDEPQKAYLVGGAVRDLLSNRPGNDLDFAVSGDIQKPGKRLANRLKGGFFMMDDEEHPTARVYYCDAAEKQWIIDLVSFRAGDLEGDLRLRDFTINALALDIDAPAQLIDPLHGAQDLKDHVLRCCSPTSLQDDPLRVMRGVRAAMQYGVQIPPETRQLMQEAAPGLARVSMERQRDELFKLLGGSKVAVSIRLLEKLGVLEVILPEVSALKGVEQSAPHIYDVYDHTLAVIQNLEMLFQVLVSDERDAIQENVFSAQAVLKLGAYRTRLQKHFEEEQINATRSLRSLLFFAALYHDIAKPLVRVVQPDGKTRFFGHDQQGALLTAERAEALMLSNDEAQRVETVVGQHMRVHFLSKGTDMPANRIIFRFYNSAKSAGIEIALLSLADVLATRGPADSMHEFERELDITQRLFSAWWDQREALVSPPRLVNGNDLMAALDLKPGRMVGELLGAIQEAQVEGVVTDRESALEYARQTLGELTAIQGRGV